MNHSQTCIDNAQAAIARAMGDTAIALGWVAQAGAPIDTYRVDGILTSLRRWATELAHPDDDADALSEVID